MIWTMEAAGSKTTQDITIKSLDGMLCGHSPVKPRLMIVRTVYFCAVNRSGIIFNVVNNILSIIPIWAIGNLTVLRDIYIGSADFLR